MEGTDFLDEFEEDDSPEESEDSDNTIKIDRTSALEEAIRCLVSAADIAEKINDAETMLNCAAGWLEVSERLSAEPERQPVGFGNFGKREKEDAD